MRRQEVVRIRSLNSNVKMIFEERSDAIEIDVSRIHEDDVDTVYTVNYSYCNEISFFYG